MDALVLELSPTEGKLVEEPPPRLSPKQSKQESMLSPPLLRLPLELHEERLEECQVADLPQSFWEEASATACYLQNRLPSKTLPNVTPYQRWTQEKPELSHVRIFGTPCYSLIPTEARTKLDPRAERCILVGYGEHFGVKTYRLYNRTTRRFVFSRDVVFNEDALLSTSITSPSRDFSPSPRTHRPGHPLDADDNTYNFEELTSQNFPPPFPVIIPMPPPQAQPLEATIPNIPTPAREFVFQARRPTATQPRRRIQNYSLPDTGVTQITYPTPQRTTSSSRREILHDTAPANALSAASHLNASTSAQHVDDASISASTTNFNMNPSLFIDDTSISVGEALASSEAPLWHAAMESEMRSLMQNRTWRLLNYISTTKSMKIVYRSGGDTTLSIQDFADADWALDLLTRISTGGFVFTLAGGPISWRSKRQSTVAVSSCEAKYRAANDTSKEAIWIVHSMVKQLLSNFSLLGETSTNNSNLAFSYTSTIEWEEPEIAYVQPTTTQPPILQPIITPAFPSPIGKSSGPILLLETMLLQELAPPRLLHVSQFCSLHKIYERSNLSFLLDSSLEPPNVVGNIPAVQSVAQAFCAQVLHATSNDPPDGPGKLSLTTESIDEISLDEALTWLEAPPWQKVMDMNTNPLWIMGLGNLYQHHLT
ncbi:hypothetical protein L7F22_036803 [Adiantum nelumboides]|nr:hypothetical protein [Adiantum nelumboides]